MAKAAKTTEEVEPTVEPVTETITYIPGPSDPSTVKTFGHVFHANVPKEITGHAEGTSSQKLNMQLIETARPKMKTDGTEWFHPCFRVGNASRPKRDASTLPTTSNEYRAYAIEWLKDPSIQHADQLIARLAKDRELHLACEVGADDFSYLATLFTPKLYELQKADELTSQQVSTIWINHGFNVLPW